MDNKIKYSVIIPFYNSERTLPRCIESLVCQQRTDVEIILVNDGSTDGSESIIRTYENKYPQLVYLRQENGGPSRARNTGLSHATGEFVTFVDSDDYVKENYFSVLDQMEPGDLVVFCHDIIGNDHRDMPLLFSQLQCAQSYEERLFLLLESRRIMSPWDKLFRKNVIDENHIRFPEGLHIGEDYNFCIRYALCCNSIAIEPRSIICNDITDQSSLSRKYRPALHQQILRGFTLASQTISHSEKSESLRGHLLQINDYLFVKLTFSCIMEEFKVKKMGYFRYRKEISAICNSFRTPLAQGRHNLMHRMLRLGLKWKLYFPFWLVSYLVNARRSE